MVHVQCLWLSLGSRYVRNTRQLDKMGAHTEGSVAIQGDNGKHSAKEDVTKYGMVGI